MLGYILAAIVGLLLVGLCFAGLGGSRARSPDQPRPNAPSQPAADEPTPDRSSTASRREVDAARRHTPPA